MSGGDRGNRFRCARRSARRGAGGLSGHVLTDPRFRRQQQRKAILVVKTPGDQRRHASERLRRLVRLGGRGLSFGRKTAARRAVLEKKRNSQQERGNQDKRRAAGKNPLLEV